MTITPVMITCEQRVDALMQTQISWNNTDTPVLLRVVMDQNLDQQDDLRWRQSANSRRALQIALEEPNDFILFLEDDLEFNKHLWHNLCRWKPLQNGLHMGSLYNPTVRAKRIPDFKQAHEEHWFIAEPDAVYGSQAFIFSRWMAKQIAASWESIPGMQDMKMSRITSSFEAPIYYHQPSLVQHVCEKSTWTDENRYHRANDYDPEFRA